MKKVLLLLANGFEIYEASSFIDVFGWNMLEGNGSVELVSVGLSRNLKSTFNQQFIPDKTLEEIELSEYDALAIPGGFEEFGFYDEAFSEKFSDVINHFASNGKIIASICVGSLALGYAGLLKDTNATTYNQNPRRIKQLCDFGAIAKDTPIVVSGNIITSWNPSTAIDVAFLLLEMLTDKENAANVRKLMGFETI